PVCGSILSYSFERSSPFFSLAGLTSSFDFASFPVEDVSRMKQPSFLFKPAVYIALAAYITLTYPVLAMGNNWISIALPEDHYFELVGAFAFLVTSILFFYGFILARRTLDTSWVSLAKKLIYLGLALLFFFGAGEEISWGQRILGFATPETLSHINRQEEFNLHNLSAWEASDFLDP